MARWYATYCCTFGQVTVVYPALYSPHVPPCGWLDAGLFCTPSTAQAQTGINVKWKRQPQLQELVWTAQIVVYTASYLHCNIGCPNSSLTFPFTQAFMPVAVYITGTLFSLEELGWRKSFNMLVIAIGIVIASVGELRFHWTGFSFQVASIAAESTRIVLIQILLQR